MSYVVSARKYRPQTFEEVVGQEHVTSTLKNALLADKLAHAFLFCGPRGVGKTTCARLLAKVINMPDPKAALADGSYAHTDIDISMNIIELDAASNNSVEHMRTLIEQVRFQPQEGTHKVFIIDEVHMLSTAAFNAFLKTLEEPPPYAIFILATTEKHKILPTIMSRCQLYDFRRIQVVDIIQQLEGIAQKEGITTEYDALYTVAEKADGAMRDALSIYDRIASASGNAITYKDVVENLNLLDYEYFFRATDLIVREDSAGLLLLLDEVLRNGFEADIFMNGLGKHLRHLMYCKQEPTLHLLQLSDTLKSRYLNQSQTVGYSTILNALAIANDSDINYPKAKDKRLHIEIALLKICYASRQIAAPAQGVAEKKNPEVKQASQQPTASPQAQTPPTPKVATQSPSPAPSQSAPAKAAPVPLATTNNTIATPAAVSKPAPKVTPVAPKSSPKLSSIEDLLSAAQETVEAKKAEAKALNVDELKEVWMAYTAKLESATSRAAMENVLMEIDGDHFKIIVPSTIAKEEIQAELGLYTAIRDHFLRSDLLLQIELDRSRFPDMEEVAQRKVYTVKEKYDHLLAINPAVDQLIDDLGLTPDSD